LRNPVTKQEYSLEKETAGKMGKKNLASHLVHLFSSDFWKSVPGVAFAGKACAHQREANVGIPF
jgi:hypothetical protein